MCVHFQIDSSLIHSSGLIKKEKEKRQLPFEMLQIEITLRWLVVQQIQTSATEIFI